MALKDIWTPLQDAVAGVPNSGSDISAKPINDIADAVIELEGNMNDGLAKKADKQNSSGGFEGGNKSSATKGGAIGNGTITGDGFAGGNGAKTIDTNENPIDAIQLGTGTNSTPKSLQVYNYQLMGADGNIPLERLNNAPKTEVVDSLESEDTTKALSAAQGKLLNDKKANRDEMFEKLCPTGSAESLTSSLTLADGCGGTNVRNYVIHGAEGGVGDLNSDTGKYEIPVTVRGKNLLARVETHTDNGITYDLNADRWIMNGSASTNSYIPMSTTQSVNLKPGTYTVSYTYISGTMDSAVPAFYLGLRRVDTRDWIKSLSVTPRNYKTKITASFTLTEENRGSWFSVGVGTVTNLTFAMQIEKGSEATDFEPYTAPKEYAISLDAPLGTGEVLTRETGGDITLTDAGTNIIEVGTATAPGKIEVEYYKDINKVVNNLTNAILAQGGNV